MRNQRSIFFCFLIGLLFFNFDLLYSEELSLFEPNGVMVKEMGEGFKMGYIAGYVNATSNIFVDSFMVTSRLVDKLNKEKAISKSFNNSKLTEIQGEIINDVFQGISFENIPFYQLLTGVDNFYEDSANMEIALPYALFIVKLRIKGAKEDFTKCMTEFYRMSASKGKHEPLTDKISGCIKLRN